MLNLDLNLSQVTPRGNAADGDMNGLLLEIKLKQWLSVSAPLPVRQPSLLRRLPCVTHPPLHPIPHTPLSCVTMLISAIRTRL